MVLARASDAGETHVFGRKLMPASCRTSATSGAAARRASQRDQRSRTETSAAFQGGSYVSSACGIMAGAVVISFAPAALVQDWPHRSMVAVRTVSAGNAGDAIPRSSESRAARCIRGNLLAAQSITEGCLLSERRRAVSGLGHRLSRPRGSC
jgi:hypothetical protein